MAGAGDTVISVLAAGFALGIDVEEACRFAMVAAGIAVEKPGVYAVTARDMERALGGISHKVVDAATAADQTRDARSAGKK
ncbi:PfkB family carbohydrate kinase, partial [Acinetobacter baumannii]